MGKSKRISSSACCTKCFVLTLTQKRYVDAPTAENEDGSWYIPLSWTVASSPDFSRTTPAQYFVDGVASHTVSLATQANFNITQHWYIFNIQQTGYYRVSYEKSNWDKLAAALNSDNYESIHLLNRAQLIDDSMEFARAGRLDYETSLSILTYLKHETDYIPWQSASSYLNTLNRYLSATSTYKNYVVGF